MSWFKRAWYGPWFVWNEATKVFTLLMCLSLLNAVMHAIAGEWSEADDSAVVGVLSFALVEARMAAREKDWRYFQQAQRSRRRESA